MASSWMQEADEYAKKYAQALKEQSQYLIDQQNQAKQNALNTIENERLNAVNTLNSGKDSVRQTAEENAKQANINRMLALRDNQGAMSRAGLSTQGIVGSQVNSINNSYGNNLNSILKDRASQLKAIDDQVNSTNLQYDTNRINSINQYDQNIADLNSQIDTNALNQYNTSVAQYLAQKQQEYENQQAEAAQQEAIRQFNEQLAYQKQQDAIKNAQTWSQINASKVGFDNTSSGNTIKTNYYEGAINPDTRYGTFGTLDKNGVKYQPNNVNGEKLSNSGYKVKDLFGDGWQGSTGASLSNQKVWKTGIGKYYVWDGSQNSYIDVTSKLRAVGNMYTAPTGVTFTK
ncbi:MAG: hypothetical protein J6K45_04280 [Clostridia bacterium]|nr:hypothetical protein [Clostridia bacterium]